MTSIVLVGFVVTIAVWNLEDSAVRDPIADDLTYHVDVLHLTQSWALFSPNPTRTSSEVYATVFRADGSSERFEFPDGGDLIGAYREYRWRKFESRLRRDNYAGRRHGVAQWIARSVANPHDVVRVELIHRWSTTPEPGSGEDRTWNNDSLGTYQVADRD